jgi:hypothetical protein
LGETETETEQARAAREARETRDAEAERKEAALFGELLADNNSPGPMHAARDAETMLRCGNRNPVLAATPVATGQRGEGASPAAVVPCVSKKVELPLDSWWFPTAGVPGWACGVSGAASRQLVVPHRWGTRLGVWCKWSCLSTAGGTPPRGYPAGRVV